MINEDTEFKDDFMLYMTQDYDKNLPKAIP